MILFEIGFYMLLAAIVFHLLTRRYLNPFRLTMVVGKKGSGKTTWMVKLIYKHIRRGWKVYANMDLPGVYYFDPQDIGKYTFPSNSCVFIDEANIYWDNRNWKKTAMELIQFFRYQRQYKVKMFLFSQTFDVDPKIRSLCDDLYLINNYARVLGYAKRIRKYPDLKQAEGESEARIVDMIQYDSFLFFMFGSRQLVYIPRWGKYFKTYNPPVLDEIPSTFMWDEHRAPKWLRRRHRLRMLVPIGRFRPMAPYPPEDMQKPDDKG